MFELLAIFKRRDSSHCRQCSAKNRSSFHDPSAAFLVCGQQHETSPFLPSAITAVFLSFPTAILRLFCCCSNTSTVETSCDCVPPLERTDERTAIILRILRFFFEKVRGPSVCASVEMSYNSVCHPDVRSFRVMQANFKLERPSVDDHVVGCGRVRIPYSYNTRKAKGVQRLELLGGYDKERSRIVRFGDTWYRVRSVARSFSLTQRSLPLVVASLMQKRRHSISTALLLVIFPPF